MLDELNYAQRERLAYIDFCLEYHGQIARADLIQRFKTGLASCSRDLSLYREIAPKNAVLKHETKKYLRSEEFVSVFDHDSESILTALSKGFGDGISQQLESSNICFDAIRLVHPDSIVVGALMRAIHSGSAIKCKYESLSSGTTTRTILPHAIVNNGHRWHVRGFDRKTNSFRDFVCTRFSKAEVIDSKSKPKEMASVDHEWNNIVPIELVPHPSIKHKKAIEMDYSMQGGILKLEVREAVVGYLLRQWNVDCSENASLKGFEHQLHLQNSQILSDIESATLAPGHQKYKDI
ncbi:MAG TPA: WYL domain-containing protein [Colwellia sp.]|nr:WYL domain-containing protein [Colwellia sp.]|tara:strand:- start:2850 stop:3728 length:879 start_codon:yes stop_codon:yes gene_type:complete